MIDSHKMDKVSIRMRERPFMQSVFAVPTCVYNKNNHVDDDGKSALVVTMYYAIGIEVWNLLARMEIYLVNGTCSLGLAKCWTVHRRVSRIRHLRVRNLELVCRSCKSLVTAPVTPWKKGVWPIIACFKRFQAEALNKGPLGACGRNRPRIC